MYGLIKPLLFKMSPSSAHAVAMAALNAVAVTSAAWGIPASFRMLGFTARI